MDIAENEPALGGHFGIGWLDDWGGLPERKCLTAAHCSTAVSNDARSSY